MPADKENRRLKVAILLPTLEMGGAERQAIELANRLDRTRFDVTLIALSEQGHLDTLLQNVPLRIIRSDSAMSTLLELIRVLRNLDVDIAQSFLLKTNVYLLLVKLFAPRLKIVIGLRDTIQDLSRFHDSSSLKWKVTVLQKLLQFLSPLATIQVSNSQAGFRNSRSSRVEVIPNGIDTERFTPDRDARQRLRNMIGATETTPIVGIVATCSVYKDYANFIHAASWVIRDFPGARFVSIGEDRTSEGKLAVQLAKDLGLAPAMHFLGARQEVEKLIPGMDVFCSSSITEGFSNAIAEAMSCGVPCVVTDVGDSALIVGETGIAVRPGKPEELGAAVTRLLRLAPAEAENLRIAARYRVFTNFGVSLMVSRYEDLYRRLVAAGAALPHANVAKTSTV